MFSTLAVFVHLLCCFTPAVIGSTFLNLADVDCGISSAVERSGKIVGGCEAEIGQFPWMVSIKRFSFREQGYAPHCGGAIINNRWVLTSAHGFSRSASNFEDYRSNFVIDIGEYDMRNRTSEFQRFRVKQFFIHPLYRSVAEGYDLALIYLNKEIDWNSVVKPLCLANDSDESFTGKMATVAGWGLTKERGEKSPVLRTVSYPVIANSECQQWFNQSARPVDLVTIRDDMLCAGTKEGGKGTCTGDSGGPLMVKHSTGRYMTTGIASLGIGCARPQLPRTFTRVTSYIDWIMATVANQYYSELKFFYRNMLQPPYFIY